MSEQLGNLRRTHQCGTLREEHIGQSVILMGWVQKRRNLGGLIFVDLRDKTGITQIIFDEAVSVEALEKAAMLKNEYVIGVTGKVSMRQSVNDKIPTGKIEIFAEQLFIYSASDVLPIHVDDQDDAKEKSRLTYRFLDLRKPKMQKIISLRHHALFTIHNYLSTHEFVNVDTPILNKPTPEGARDYLVPSRVNPGHFYALPQSPQLFKQLLMVAGTDRYYQVAKCFRDEDLRADRQPEFSQVDIEMSFVDEEDVREMTEGLYQHIFKQTIGIDLPVPFQTMTYDEAMNRFGSDKPDLRFGFELKNISEVLQNTNFEIFKNILASNGTIRAISIDGYGENFSRKKISKLEELAKTYGAKALSYIKVTSEGVSSSLAKVLSEDEIQAVISQMNAGPGDIIFIVADQPSVVFNTLAHLRKEIATQLGLINPNEYKVLWVVDMPLYEYDEEAGRYFAAHHPFTMPKNEYISMIASNPEVCRAKAYDLVINGYEAAGGSIRIHSQELQQKMFEALGFTEEMVQEKFGFFVNALRYGTPPHGGIALGVERLIMLLAKTDNIKDVIAFPKTQDAKCLMSGAPSSAEKSALEELAIEVKDGVLS